MRARFEQFIHEHQYLNNVAPTTVAWYRNSLRWLPCDNPTDDDLKAAVVGMREKGRKATGCNCAIRAINAYLKWSGSPLKIPKLKEPQLALPMFSASEVRRFGRRCSNFGRNGPSVILRSMAECRPCPGY